MTGIRTLVQRSVLFAVLFSASFAFFYVRQRRQAGAPVNRSLASMLNHQAPQIRLIDSSGARTSTDELCRGKTVLIFVAPGCDYCDREADLLRPLLNQDRSIRFAGIAPLSSDPEALKSADREFPFKIYFDDGLQLSRALGIDAVPVKLYLEEGILRKVWTGSESSTQQPEFSSWIASQENSH